ncbi:MAG: CHAT domain-containing protein [Chitinophagales bacterium]
MKQTINNFLVISPDFSSTNLTPLPHNASLAEKIVQKYQKTNLLNRSQATISNFKQAAQQANIIHLASHASLATDSVPERHIVLSDGSLLSSHFTDTIFQNCDLAVLACCNTGNGKYEQGIGIRSLNYDFRRHNAKCVLSTLWRVADEPTSKLLEYFYDFLAQGKRKNIALKEAKLKYLKEFKKCKAPYYWAAFMLNGQTNAVVLEKKDIITKDSSNSYHIWYCLAIFIVLFAATIIGWFRKKTKN